MRNDNVYIGVPAEDRNPPVIAETPDECAQKAMEEWDLRYSAGSIDTWDKRHSWDDDREHWRIKVSAHWWDYASIHGINPEEIS